MSFYRLGGGHPERGRGLPSSAEEGYSALCLSLAASLIVVTRDEVHALFKGLTPDAAATVPDDEQVSPDEEARDAELEVGETASTNLNEEIRLMRKRIDEDEVEMSYLHRATGEMIFSGTVSAAKGLQFEYIDPYYWQISIDGATTSRSAVERMVENEFLMRVDVEERRIFFKTREPLAEPNEGQP
jgi:hypothetical protein